jgi:predicted metal-dependent hydrolase
MCNSTFQHRHYKAIADILADAREARTSISKGCVIDDLELRFVQAFKRDNPKFLVERFRAAAQRLPTMHGKDKVR